MGGVSGVNSLHYILLCGVAALRLAEAPGRSGLVASSRYKEFVFTAYFVMPDIRNCCAVLVSSDRCVGRPAVGRIGVEVEGVMKVWRGV